jgi:hypothetical protein
MQTSFEDTRTIAWGFKTRIVEAAQTNKAE